MVVIASVFLRTIDGEGPVGIGGNDLRLLTKLKMQDLLPDGLRVVEVGAQQLSQDFLSCRSELNILGRLFGIQQRCPLPEAARPPSDAPGLQPLDLSAPAAREF